MKVNVDVGLTIEAYNTDEVFHLLKKEWGELLQKSQQNHIFVTWEWQYHWWQAYHPGQLWVITVRNPHADDELVGIFPWFIHERPQGRTVRSIGCVDVTDYINPLIKTGCEQPCLEALAAFLVEEEAQYDLLDLCNIPGAAPILEYLPPLLKQRGFEVTVQQQEVCPIIVLPESWDEYLAMLDKKQRHELRRKMRRLFGQDFETNWGYIDPATEDLDAAMERFMHLMQSTNPDKREFLSDPQNVDFFRRVIPAMAERGWLAMSFMQINGRDAAAYLSFDYDNRILLYNSGQDLSVYGDLSTGVVLLGLMIRDAIEKGRAVFDFLRGNEKYKYYMGGVDTPVMMLSAQLN